MCKVCNNSGCPACEPDVVECPECWGDGVYLETDDGERFPYEKEHEEHLTKRICSKCCGCGTIEE